MADDARIVPAFLQPVDSENWSYEGSDAIEQRCHDLLGEIVKWIRICAAAPMTALWFEPRLVKAVLSLGLLLMQLFLTRADEVVVGRLGPDQIRNGSRFVASGLAWLISDPGYLRRWVPGSVVASGPRMVESIDFRSLHAGVVGADRTNMLCTLRS